MSKPIHILNGPNLNLLGQREPEIYGRETLEEIRARCEAAAAEAGFEMLFKQTNHEGELIDWVQAAGLEAGALVINPAGYGHTSVALHDALKALDLPVIEVHLSQPAKREAFRHHSYVTTAATGAITGFGPLGYVLGIQAAAALIARAAGA